MLDKSGSMGEPDTNGKSRWQNLQGAVNDFMNIFENDNALKNSSRVSVIIYDSSSQNICELQIPSKDCVKI